MKSRAYLASEIANALNIGVSKANNIIKYKLFEAPIGIRMIREGQYRWLYRKEVLTLMRKVLAELEAQREEKKI
jgi:hypothetical protein